MAINSAIEKALWKRLQPGPGIKLHSTTPHAPSTLGVTSCCWAFIAVDKQPGKSKH